MLRVGAVNEKALALIGLSVSEVPGPVLGSHPEASNCAL